MTSVYAFLLDDTTLTSAYATPLLAAMMRPVHAFDPSVRCAPVVLPGRPGATYDGLRVLPSLVDVPQDFNRLPDIPSHARIAWAVLCGRACYIRPSFVEWSDAWLSGRTRDPQTAFSLMWRLPPPRDDSAYVQHWALMAAAFPHEPTLAAQTAALAAAYVFPAGTFDFQAAALAALDVM